MVILFYLLISHCWDKQFIYSLILMISFDQYIQSLHGVSYYFAKK